MYKENLVKSFIIDKMEVGIYKTEEAMGIADAVMISETLKKLLKEKETVNMVFAPAASHYAVYKHLFSIEGIEWNRVNAFHLDEYVGLSDDSPERIANFAKVHIFSKAPFKNTYCMNSNVSDPEAECKRYEELLRKHPLDIGVIGIGQNGHIAYNEPHVADFNDPRLVKVVEIDEQSINQAAEKDNIFKNEDSVPRIAMTMTIPAIMSANYLFIAVPKSHKQKAVKDAIEGEITEKCPASILRTHKCAKLFLDMESAAALKILQY